MRVLVWLKYQIMLFIPVSVWNKCALVISKPRNRKYLEHKKKFGKLNPDKTFYLIRRRPPGWGFFSNVLFVCQGIIYAQKNNLVPVVDMENYWMRELNSVKKVNGTYNAWCYFFQQTSSFSLEEVYKSKNVILSAGSEILGSKHWLSTKNIDPVVTYNNLMFFRSILDNYIKLNESTKCSIEETNKNLNWQPAETLGVFIRGKVYEHKIAATFFNIPELDSLTLEIEKTLQNYKLNNLFIVTESFQIYENLRVQFSNYNIIPSLRFDKNFNKKAWDIDQRETWDGGIYMGYEKTLTYLTEMSLLSNCKHFIGTHSNATIYSLARANLSTGVHKILLDNKILDINSLVK